MTAIQIIANPVAGGGRGNVMAQALVGAIEAHGLSVTLFATTKAGDAREAASRTTADVIAVVGGDGTLNEVLNGLPEGSSAALAILPVGTANVVARELGMKSDPAFVAAVIAANHRIPMDVGLFEARRFLLGAGAGLDAAVTKAVQERRGNKSSLLKWVWPALKTVLGYCYPKITVVVDGKTLVEDADYVIIGNCRNSAGIFPATPLAKISDGKFDVCAFSGLSLPRLAWLLVIIWRPSFIQRPWIQYRYGQDVEIRPYDPAETVYLQIDGDPAGTIPARFRIAAWQISMVVPHANDRNA